MNNRFSSSMEHIQEHGYSHMFTHYFIKTSVNQLCETQSIMSDWNEMTVTTP